MNRLSLVVLVLLFLGWSQRTEGSGIEQEAEGGGALELGAFSISLAVKDLEKSRAFYEKLGFDSHGGDASKNYLILKNGDTVIGLFQGMFEGHMLTFNPGWDQQAKPLKKFTDVRVIQSTLVERGVEPVQKADEKSTGPASMILADPDGNVILIDQHR